MNSRIVMRMCFVLCAVMLCFASSAPAQVNTATLTGTILDPQGMGVKGAKITLENSADGAQRTAEADDYGRYNIVGLPPGSYRVTVEGGAGFGRYENPALTLTVGEDATLDPQLSLSGVSQTVTVSTETAVHRAHQNGSLADHRAAPHQQFAHQRPQLY
jgi:protocatechuate 3,4-dioxygenase beta subunit